MSTFEGAKMTLSGQSQTETRFYIAKLPTPEFTLHPDFTTSSNVFTAVDNATHSLTSESWILSSFATLSVNSIASITSISVSSGADSGGAYSSDTSLWFDPYYSDKLAENSEHNITLTLSCSVSGSTSLSYSIGK